MRTRNFLLCGLLITATAFGFAACGDDDPIDEPTPVDPIIPVDPTPETPTDEKVDNPTADAVTAYYIAGTVSDANGVIEGAKVETTGVSAETDANGAYLLMVSAADTYTVKFSAEGLEDYEGTITIPADAAARSQVTLSVTLAKAITFEAAPTETVSETEEVTVTAPATEGAATEVAAVVTVPAAAAEAGTTISVTTYEEATTADNTTVAEEKKVEIPVSNVAIQTVPADAVAKEDISISIPNAAAEEGCYFDPASMIAIREDLGSTASTRAEMKKGVKVENGHYVLTIEKDQPIAGKYSTKVTSQVKADKVTTGENNASKRITNDDYAAKEETIEIDVKGGWEYDISPAAALSNAGVSEKLSADIEKAIAASEGAAGTFTTKKSLKIKIGGHYVFYYTSKQKVQTKSYTYQVINQAGQSVSVTVTLKKYVGDEEDTTYGSISEHSGGTGSSN